MKSDSINHPRDENIPEIEITFPPFWEDYELLDSGNGRKLERFGKILLDRPEAEAFWQPALPLSEWKKAHATFVVSPEENGGHWICYKTMPDRWSIEYKNLKFWLQISTSKHIGVFPEQASQWDWITTVVNRSKKPIKVLNLFGYTGIATLAASSAGAQVTHLDASKKTISWAKENQSISDLGDNPIRWIIDDALKFVHREIRRGVIYGGIILDPPKFGRGPKGEVWEFYKYLPELIRGCKGILSPDPEFVLLTAYAVKASAITLYNVIAELMDDFPGKLTTGEVVLLEKAAGRVLSMAVFTRWSNRNLV